MGIISDAIDALEDWCKDLFKKCVLLQLRGKGIEAVVLRKPSFQYFGMGGKLPGIRMFQQGEYGLVSISSGTCVVAGSL